MLAQRVADGETGAAEELERVINAMYEGVDLRTDTKRRDENARIGSAAAAKLGSEAVNGKVAAFEALKRSLARGGHMASFAPTGIGIVAMAGNEEALQILLDYEAHGMYRSTAVWAMRFPAMQQNPKAIKFLADVLADSEAKALWPMAAAGLDQPAKSGNAEATRALQAYRAAGGK